MSLAENGSHIATKLNYSIYLGLYVDDIILVSKCLEHLTQIKEALSREFEMKDMGPIKKFLNIQIDYKPKYGVLSLSQKEAILRVLKAFRMSDCSSVCTPMTNIKELEDETSPEINSKYPYRQLIGSLMYIVLGSRPEICFAVTFLSTYLSQPRVVHWRAAKRILRYPKGSVSTALVYRSPAKGTVNVYSDADWANKKDRKSISGATVFHDGNLINWFIRKQSCITLSTTEAELVALSESLKEGLWTVKILKDLSLQYSVSLNYI